MHGSLGQVAQVEIHGHGRYAAVQQGTTWEIWRFNDQAHVEAASILVRQVAVNMDMLALLAAVVRAPRYSHGGLMLGIDCQAIVQGFAKKEALVDHGGCVLIFGRSLYFNQVY